MKKFLAVAIFLVSTKETIGDAKQRLSGGIVIKIPNLPPNAHQISGQVMGWGIEVSV